MVRRQYHAVWRDRGEDAADLHPAATALVYTLGSPGACSEFLMTYAGLPLGIAAMFLVLGGNPDAYRIGLTAAILLYLPIVACRMIPPLIAGKQFVFAFRAAGVDSFLLAAAIVLRLLANAEPGEAA